MHGTLRTGSAESADTVAAAEAAADARQQKAQRTSSSWSAALGAGADATARARDIQALEWREREATALATRASRRGSLTAMRARRESVHIAYVTGTEKVKKCNTCMSYQENFTFLHPKNHTAGLLVGLAQRENFEHLRRLEAIF